MFEITPVSEPSKLQPVALEEVVDLADGFRQPVDARLVEEFGPHVPAAKKARK